MVCRCMHVDMYTCTHTPAPIVHQRRLEPLLEARILIPMEISSCRTKPTNQKQPFVATLRRYDWIQDITTLLFVS